MRMQDIIKKKRDGHAVSKEEINFLITGAINNNIPAYQVSAFLMAIYFQGMNNDEITDLTSSIIESGKNISLTSQHSPYVDKHSTGGVGDGTSLIVAPIISACGLHIPMISGRALGHTGGTLDKLDSIPHYNTQLTMSQFVNIVDEHGYAMCGQTNDLAPADKVLYALRDVTGTVESIPLITSSILSKKIAEGTDVLVIDVKCGNGAFAHDMDFAQKLARQLIKTGNRLHKNVKAIITDMNQPLGVMIGNFLEVEQAAVVLNGYSNPIYRDEYLSDYLEVSVNICMQILVSAKKAETLNAARRMVNNVLTNGSAWDCFCKNVSIQGGNLDQLQGMFGVRRARYSRNVYALKEGYIENLDALTFGNAASLLGVGRRTVDSIIDPEAGIQLCAKYGAHVSKNEPVCIIHSNTESFLDEADALICEHGIRISQAPPPRPTSLILGIIEK